MIVINLFGPPGTGKSTGAAYIFSQLKMMGINAELVTEFAKDKIWEHNTTALSNQAYVFGKQYYRISRCANQVDVIVTDSPLLLSLIYCKDEVLGKDFKKVVHNVFNSFNNVNFLLRRVKPYNPSGRNQTEKESDEIGEQVESILIDSCIDFSTYDADISGYNAIVGEIIHILGGLR